MDIEAALERIKAVVGARGWIAEPADQELAGAEAGTQPDREDEQRQPGRH